MKKIFLFLLFAPFLAKSQVVTQSICMQADCKTTIQFPQDSISLNSLATSPDGIKSILWQQLFGPAGSVIAQPTVGTTMVRKLQPGTYIFSITGTTNKNLIGVARDTVIVSPVFIDVIDSVRTYYHSGKVVTNK